MSNPEIKRGICSTCQQLVDVRYSGRAWICCDHWPFGERCTGSGLSLETVFGEPYDCDYFPDELDDFPPFRDLTFQ